MSNGIGWLDNRAACGRDGLSSCGNCRIYLLDHFLMSFLRRSYGGDGGTGRTFGDTFSFV